MTFDIDVVVTLEPAPAVDVLQLRNAATVALEIAAAVGPATLSIALVDDATIRALNARHRGHDEPTDVLAFGPGTATEFVLPPGSPPYLGDVVISLPQAARQAEEQGHPVADELTLLVVHGLLHLLGYDHEAEEDAERMEARQAEALARLRTKGVSPG